MRFSDSVAEDYLAKLQNKQEKVAQDKSVQATRHQQDALETAKLFNDMASKGLYFRIFKKYGWGPQRDGLLKCRDWVLNNVDKQYQGRTFVKIYKKFI